MAVTKRKGRPVTREAPAAGKRTQLSVAIPQPLKRQVEKAAKAHGWSISAETTYRLEMSFSQVDAITDAVREAVRAELTQPQGTWRGLTDTEGEAEKKRSG